MGNSYSYQVKDEARRLYMDEDYSLASIAKFAKVKKVSFDLIPYGMRLRKEKYEIEKAKRLKKEAREREKYLKRYKNAYTAFQIQRDHDRATLKPKDASKVQKMAKPFEKANALSRTNKIKQNQNAGERWLSSRSVSL